MSAWVFFIKNKAASVATAAAVSLYFSAIMFPSQWLQELSTQRLSGPVQLFYSRYFLGREINSRVLTEPVVVKLDRDAPPVAALEDVLRTQSWSVSESVPFQAEPKAYIETRHRTGEEVAREILALNRLEWDQLRIAENLEREKAQKTVLAIQQMNRRPLALHADQEGVTPVIALLPQAPTTDKTIKITAEHRDLLLNALIAAFSADKTQSIRKTQNERQPQKQSNALASRGLSKTRQVLLKGPIEFSGGLAMTRSTDKILLSREFEGRLIESGTVSLSQGNYEIFVDSLEGRILAELRSPHGEVVGKGEIELSALNDERDRHRIDGVLLKVIPALNGLQGRIRSMGTDAKSSNTQAKIQFIGTGRKGTFDSKGGFFEKQLSNSSRVIARLSLPGHRPTLVSMLGGRDTEIQAISSQLVDVIDRQLAEAGDPSRHGYVWGRIVKGQSPVANAQVEVQTQGALAPIYLNDLYLPDKQLQQTSSSGIFVIPISNGLLHTVQVSIRGRTSDPIFLPAEEGSVTSVDLDILGQGQYPARAYDAFKTDWLLNSQVRFLGHKTERIANLYSNEMRQGKSSLPLRHLGQAQIVDVNAGPEYLQQRFVLNPSQKEFSFPMLQKSWFDSVVSQLRFNPSASEGSVVGFVQGQRFVAKINITEKGHDTRIMYFNESGNLTGKSYGEAGGGFVLLGVPNGMQTVVIQSDGGDSDYAATVLIDNESVSTLNYWIH